MILLILLFLFFPPISSFEFVSESPIEDVVVYNEQIFVGTVNGLSSLWTSNLSIQQSLSLGPVPDSPFCLEGGECLRGHSRAPTAYHHKILSVVGDVVLLCGSVRQGMCVVRSVEDLSVVREVPVAVAANAENASTIALRVGEGFVVGASYTGDSPYRDVPSLAYRTWPDLQVVNGGSLEGESSVFIRAEYRPLFPITFVSSFTDGRFVYVGMVEPSTARRVPPMAPLVTKLARFCQNDTRFSSYSEVEIQCRNSDNSNLNILTAMRVHDGKVYAAFSGPSGNGLCVYTLDRLKLIFWYNVDRCRGGSDSIGLAHIGRDAKCLNRVALDENQCDIGVGGTIEEVEMAIFSSSSKILSILSVPEHSILLMSLADGFLVKMRIKEGASLVEYDRTRVADGPVTARSVIGRNILVQQENTMRYVPLSECSSHETCSTCLQSDDPLCGWCAHSSSCSSSCPSPSLSVCPSPRPFPSPATVLVGVPSNLTLLVADLPSPHLFHYECYFDGISSYAEYVSEGLHCPLSPPSSSSSPLRTYPLFIRTNTSSKILFSYEISVLDCAQFTSCSACSASSGCSWCGGCVPSLSCSSTSTECVQIQSDRIRIPNGRKADISFTVKNIQPVGDYSCRVKMNDGDVTVAAKVKGERMNCEGIRIGEDGDDTRSVRLQVLRGNEVLDETTMDVFECGELSDCSRCVSAEWGCSWCSSFCSFECPRSAPPRPCDSPVIHSFWPRSGPLEGGTILSVRGADLGVRRGEVDGRILVGASRCHLRDFNVSTGFTCVVDKGAVSGPIRVAIGPVTAESLSIFSFVESAISSLSPPFGPVSGGTTVKVFGRNMDAGSVLKVMFGEKECAVRERSTSWLSCVTSPSTAIGSVPILLQVDAASHRLPLSFEYRADPMIIDVDPLTAFRSGGRSLWVKGRNFDSVISARMMLLSSNTEPYNLASDRPECRLINATAMECPSPSLGSHLRRNTLSRLPIGFSMDGVGSLSNLGRAYQLLVVPDPLFEPFNGIRYHIPLQPLILEGANLTLGATARDYKVYIGDEECPVSLVDMHQLVCSSPPSEPPSTDGDPPLVSVHIGHLRYELGLLEYSRGRLHRRLVFLLSIPATLLPLLLLLLLLLWRRRKRERERDYKKIQMQMEHLESNVRKECREAFVELQTTMGSGKATEEDVSILNFDEFVSRLLLEGIPHHSNTLYTSLPVTLAQFDSLLGLGEFAVSLVQCAEVDPSISLQEKSVISSLFVSCLLANPVYLSEVVLLLLRQHISNTVQFRSPSLLFRQSESLTEMVFSKWLSLCMYNEVCRVGARQLHILHTALKVLSERGPVDSVTGDARYTINESRLLRGAPDFFPLDVLVLFPDSSSPLSVRVLSCDSIVQAKRKMFDCLFRGISYSLRPSHSLFILEWHRENGDVFVLKEDESERKAKGPRRMKTLADYAITSNALFVLVQSRKSPSSGDSGKSSWSSLDSSASAASTYHLTLPPRITDSKRILSESIPKDIPEVYLTRLLSSKGTVQEYIDRFLDAVLFVEEESVPDVLKVVFDTLDEEARRNKLTDEKLVHQWKANCLILRFWSTLLSNPRVLLDVDPCLSVDGSLSVILQTLMASFSSSDLPVHVDSPSSRLLFAREISRCRPQSSALFRRVASSASASAPPSFPSPGFARSFPLSELLTWVRGNGVSVVEYLNSHTCPSLRLSLRLSRILDASIDPDHIYATLS